MSNLSLYIASVLIWGSTWYAIKFQLGTVPPAVSVMWRFLLAALILLAYATLRRLPLQFSRRDHLWFALQGLMLFCLNYICTYMAEQYLTSGLVAVIFSLLAIGNIIGMRVLFGQPVHTLGLVGATVGIVGVALLFWPDIERLLHGHGSAPGLLLALIATALASLGNMVASRNWRRKLPVIQVNAWSMLYGGIIMGAYALATGQSLAIDRSWSYLAALAYLSLFGSVLAFGAYLTLMGRVGADRAGYAMVAIPVVALAISTLLEGLHWTLLMWVGIALCLAGNVLVLRRKRS